MSLAEETARVAGGGKNTLKTMLQKLGVSVGTQTIDQYPTLANQISNKLLPNNLISSSTATSLGLAGTATPNEAFAKIKALIDAANSNANAKCRIATGSYVGDGNDDRELIIQFPWLPKWFALAESSYLHEDGYTKFVGAPQHGNSTAQSQVFVPAMPTSYPPLSQWWEYDGFAHEGTQWMEGNSFHYKSRSGNYFPNDMGWTYYWVALG